MGKLTKPQRYMLAWLSERNPVSEQNPYPAKRTRMMRVLEERGLVQLSIGRRQFSITAAGRTALQEESK